MGYRVDVVYSLNLRCRVWSSFLCFTGPLSGNIQGVGEEGGFQIFAGIALVIILFCDG